MLESPTSFCHCCREVRRGTRGGTSLVSALCGSGSLHPTYCASSRLKYSNRAIVDARAHMLWSTSMRCFVEIFREWFWSREIREINDPRNLSAIRYIHVYNYVKQTASNTLNTCCKSLPRTVNQILHLPSSLRSKNSLHGLRWGGFWIATPLPATQTPPRHDITCTASYCFTFS